MNNDHLQLSNYVLRNEMFSPVILFVGFHWVDVLMFVVCTEISSPNGVLILKLDGFLPHIFELI